MRFLLGSISIVLLLVTALLGNLVQMLSLLFYPISKKLVRKINTLVVYLWWSLCDICATNLCGIEVVITGDHLPTPEQALIIANHQEMPDILVILHLARQQGSIANVKWFAKYPLKFIPGIGWGMLFLDCLFVKRNWNSDKENILKVFSRYREERIPFWLVSFLEGTRAKPAKILKSQEYARKNGLSPLKHVMLPRSKGFAATLEGLSGLYDAVYDLTIGYEDRVPTLGSYFYSNVRRVHLHVRRFSSASLPAGDKERNEWVMQRFKEKDQLLEIFYRSGRFGA